MSQAALDRALRSRADPSVGFDASESLALISAMLQAKFTEEEGRKVAGENTLRFRARSLPG